MTLKDEEMFEAVAHISTLCRLLGQKRENLKLEASASYLLGEV